MEGFGETAAFNFSWVSAKPYGGYQSDSAFAEQLLLLVPFVYFSRALCNFACAVSLLISRFLIFFLSNKRK